MEDGYHRPDGSRVEGSDEDCAAFLREHQKWNTRPGVTSKLVVVKLDRERRCLRCQEAKKRGLEKPSPVKPNPVKPSPVKPQEVR